MSVTKDYVEVSGIFPLSKPSKKNLPENLLYSCKLVDAVSAIRDRDFQPGANLLVAKYFTFQGPDGPRYFAHVNAIVATWND
jgi:hypothetical protein